MNISTSSNSVLNSIQAISAQQAPVLPRSGIDIPLVAPSPDANTLPDAKDIKQFQESDSALGRFISIKV